MKYICQTCLKADVLILIAIICLSLTQRGKFKIPSWVMAGAMSLVMLTVSIFVTPVNIGNVSGSKNIVKTPQLDANIIKLAKNKPVLLFNPKCPACIEITSSLTKLDPMGSAWQPVQVADTPENVKKYLRDKGYKGEVIFQRYIGIVPTLIVNANGKTEQIRGNDKYHT